MIINFSQEDSQEWALTAKSAKVHSFNIIVVYREIRLKAAEPCVAHSNCI